MPDYPIVYVRGFAPSVSRETVFHDAYYGFADTSVAKRPAPAPRFFDVEIFEGQLIRLLKDSDPPYVDATNSSSRHNKTPLRSIWISRFYDEDFIRGTTRPIEEHAKDLSKLLTETIPTSVGQDGKVVPIILIAHSMGGLICRCLLQNILPAMGKDPAKYVHRFITLGTPHKGIESVLPTALEEALMSSANVAGTAIFREKSMRQYLKIPKEHALNEIGWQDKKNHQIGYPPENCLCIIGSDHNSYGLAKNLIGSHSDGLVLQSHAYIQNAYYANVHRAHSGYQGIVNSVESYHNMRRFLFGDWKVSLWLDDLKLKLPPKDKKFNEQLFLNVAIAIRGTGTYIHRREQTPCENGILLRRNAAGALELQDAGSWASAESIFLHTGFLDSTLSIDQETDENNETAPWSNFQIRLGVIQHRYTDGFLGFGKVDYPETFLYQDSVEIGYHKTIGLRYRWIDSTMPWEKAPLTGEDILTIPLRPAPGLDGAPKLNLRVEHWNQS